jgi:uncharacterized OB-fold protein
MTRIATSAETVPFWEGVEAEEFRLQRCGSCGRAVFFPRVLCPHCHSDDLSWFRASGQGTIYSYTVVRRTWGVFAEDVPYVVVLVDLDEGPRFLSRLVGDAPVEIGQRVEVVFSDLDVEDGPVLPCFQQIAQ